MQIIVSNVFWKMTAIELYSLFYPDDGIIHTRLAHSFYGVANYPTCVKFSRKSHPPHIGENFKIKTRGGGGANERQKN